MTKATASQIRKIHALANEVGIDNDTLHSHIYNITKKKSIKELNITDAINVIDSLQTSEKGRMTWKQRRFIFSLASQLKWVDEKGMPDEKIITGFVKKKANVISIDWLTQKQASVVIDAMKAILKKDKEKTADD